MPRPKLVESLEGHSVNAIGAGKAHTLALTEDGAVLSFGLQTYGRLGRKEANTSSDKPLGPGRVEVADEATVMAVAAGDFPQMLIYALFLTECSRENMMR